MTDDSVGSPVERLASLSSALNGGSCVTASYDRMISLMSNHLNPDRAWLYQTCSEWGFYQTCEVDSECPFSQGLHDLSVDYEICSAAFNISAEAVNKQIAYTNTVYGEKHPGHSHPLPQRPDRPLACQ